MNQDGKLVNFEKEIAMMLNATFANNFTNTSHLSVSDVDASYEKMQRKSDFQLNITYKEVLHMFCHALSGAAGPDGLNSDIIHKIAPLIAKPQFAIYQYSVFYCVFPSAWKRARITPVYKGKGSRTSSNSYRPISLCDIFGKCLERIIINQVNKHIEDYLIAPAFRTGRTTITNFLEMDKYISNG